MKFICKTFFDITATGVTGHYKSSRVPFNDLSNVTIEDERSWNYARNQQRNWETITQLIGLRTQISQIENPTKLKIYGLLSLKLKPHIHMGPKKTLQNYYNLIVMVYLCL